MRQFSTNMPFFQDSSGGLEGTPNLPVRKIAKTNAGNTKQKSLTRTEKNGPTRHPESRKQLPTLRSSHTPKVTWCGVSTRRHSDDPRRVRVQRPPVPKTDPNSPRFRIARGLLFLAIVF